MRKLGSIYLLIILAVLSGCGDDAASGFTSNDNATGSDHSSLNDYAGTPDSTTQADYNPKPDYATTSDKDSAIPDSGTDEHITPDYAQDETQTDNAESDADAIPAEADITSAEADTETPDIDEKIIENPFIRTADEPVSTFGIDVDTASYTMIRKYLMFNKNMPPAEKVRIEEMINYFDYSYPLPAEGAEHPFTMTVEISPCPWNENHELLMIGLKGKDIPKELRKPSNLVFLIDISGSMEPANRLALLKKSLLTLTDNLGANDTISIITFNESAKEVLAPTSGSDKVIIKAAINSLQAGGSTNGGAGIELAYSNAEANLDKDRNNRVILATDGEFNTGGFQNQAQLEQLIVSKRSTGIYLTVLGFGEVNTLNDGNLEVLADKGNGNYFFIDNENELNRVLNDKIMSLLFTIAKDVKIQLDFNPSKIYQYRLIGYDNRVMDNTAFNDDTVDSGELGAGHTVTAFYEIEFTEGMHPFATFVDDNYLTLTLRYKQPDSDMSQPVDRMVTVADYFTEMSENMSFASAVTEFGLLLRKSQYRFDASYDAAKARAASALGSDPWKIRAELLDLIATAKDLDK